MNYPDEAQATLSQEAYYKNNAMRGAGTVAAPLAETELSSLLSTLHQQAFEVRGITAAILQRVYPQAQEDASEKQCFGAGYVGRAEEIRSTLSEAIRLLGTLAKIA